MSRTITIFRRQTDTQKVESFCSAELIRGIATQLTFVTQEWLPFGMKYAHYVLLKGRGDSKEELYEILVPNLSKNTPPYAYIVKVGGKYEVAKTAAEGKDEGEKT